MQISPTTEPEQDNVHPEERQRKTSVSTSAKPQTARLLIVDGDPSVHEALRSLLTPNLSVPRNKEVSFTPPASNVSPEPPTFYVDTAFQGRDALPLAKASLLENRPYTMAFVDISVAPGWDCVEDLWDIDPNLFVVLTSDDIAFDWEPLRHRLEGNPNLLVLKKPFDSVEVRQVISTCTQRLIRTRERNRRTELLHDHVEIRTLELEKANEQLVAEIEKIEKVESSLRQTQKMEALGRLVGSVGHEINNPLSFVTANTEWLIDTLPRDLVGEDVFEALDEMAIGVERIRRIVHDLKVFGGQDTESAQEVDLCEVLQLALRLVENQLGARASVKTDFQCRPKIWTTRSRLQQVFVNILFNAAQAFSSQNSGEQVVSLTVKKSGLNMVNVTVSDTGPGIDPSVIDKIFEPFFTTKKIGTATGMGLTICHNIVTSIGGEIDIRSEESGTTVSVELPILEATNGQETTSIEQKRGSVLIVDDEPLVCRSLKRLLKDYHVEVQPSARAALDGIRDDKYDAVICDLMMPEMSGMEFHAELVKKSPELASRVIFVTGGAFTEMASNFIESCSQPVLDKPIHRQSLMDILEQLTDG